MSQSFSTVIMNDNCVGMTEPTDIRYEECRFDRV
ncbi:hypothetical protein SAMN05216564_1198 [Halopenitus persicus]|uniref:Uncharacterized protein n=1 Tax=Halopenitus persicus TaxID=1048396 RepID=A0A1H3P4S2_9EURY|nr:hypothetical protein SAMN05216564_1198 [Halopenitus persicus]